MSKKVYTYGPVVLEGYQAILKPSKEYNNFTLQFLTDDDDLISSLDEEFEQCVAWLKSKAKNPKRVQVLAPWLEEEDKPGFYRLKFGWKAGYEPVIVDSEGTVITDPSLPLYSGSKVRVRFSLRPYTKPNPGVKLQIIGIQVVSVASNGGFDGESPEDVAAAFGKYDGGFVADEPNISRDEGDDSEEDDDEIPF